MDNSGTLTSSQDPHSQRSRVFVGNLNTAQVSRGELEQRFSRYGAVIGISVHKGYGFVQFADEWSARAAVQGEDGQFYHGMRVDANIASEPKQRRNLSGVVSVSSGGQPAVKRARQDLSGTASVTSINSTGGGQGLQASSAALSRKTSNLVSLVAPSHPVAPEEQPEKRPTLNDPTVKDLLICGSCREVLPDLTSLAAHKNSNCRLRQICRCLQAGEPTSMDCGYCGANFLSAWELLLHCRDEHDLLLFGGPPAAAATAAAALTTATAASAPTAVSSESNGQ